MTFRASNVGVQARQREPRFRMVDLCGCFPVDEVVALQAVLPELAVMYIPVAGHARLRQPEKGPAQVLQLDRGTFRGLDMSRRVTLAAFNSRMLSLQLVARLAVIERMEGGLPVDQRKVLAVVLRVAFRAVLLAWESGVQPAVIADFPCDFRVALLALEKRGSPAYRVAGRALCRPAHRLMSFRQRPRRNLAGKNRRSSKEKKDQSDQGKKMAHSKGIDRRPTQAASYLPEIGLSRHGIFARICV